MNMREALQDAGLKVTEAYKTKEDVTNLLRLQDGADVVKVANELYLMSSELTDDDIEHIEDICRIGDKDSISKIREHRYMFRKISYKQLNKYRYVMYVSKKYGMCCIMTLAENESAINSRFEEILASGEVPNYEQAYQQDYIALFINNNDYVDTSYIKNGTKVTKPCLGKNINEKVANGTIKLDGFFDRGGIVNDNHFYLMHKNEYGEYYLTRYRDYNDGIQKITGDVLQTSCKKI